MTRGAGASIRSSTRCRRGLSRMPRVCGVRSLLAVVLALSWQALRGIHTHEVRAILRTLATGPLLFAALITILNIAIMGLYDVMAFAEHPHDRRRAMEVRCGGVLLEQLPHAWSARRSGDSFLALSPQCDRAVGAARRHRLRDHRIHVGSRRVDGGHADRLSRRRRTSGSCAGRPGLRDDRGVVRTRNRPAHGSVRQLRSPDRRRTFEMALVGWLDWLLGAVVFVACLAGDRPIGTALDLVRRVLLRPGHRAREPRAGRIRQQRRLLDRPASVRSERHRRSARERSGSSTTRCHGLRLRWCSCRGRRACRHGASTSRGGSPRVSLAAAEC